MRPTAFTSALARGTKPLTRPAGAPSTSAPGARSPGTAQTPAEPFDSTLAKAAQRDPPADGAGDGGGACGAAARTASSAAGGAAQETHAATTGATRAVPALPVAARRAPAPTTQAASAAASAAASVAAGVEATDAAALSAAAETDPQATLGGAPGAASRAAARAGARRAPAGALEPDGPPQSGALGVAMTGVGGPRGPAGAAPPGSELDPNPAAADATAQAAPEPAAHNRGAQVTAAAGADAAQLAALAPMLAGAAASLATTPDADAGASSGAGPAAPGRRAPAASAPLAGAAAPSAAQVPPSAGDRGSGAAAVPTISSDTGAVGAAPPATVATLAPPPAPTPHGAAEQIAGAGTIQSPVGAPQWSDELGSHVTLLLERGIQSAEIKLTPPELGPLHVHIDVQNGATSVWFQAADAHTRAALELSLPRLHELFSSQGLALADAGVHREPPRQLPALPAAGTPTIEAAAEQRQDGARRVRLGLVDAYA